VARLSERHVTADAPVMDALHRGTVGRATSDDEAGFTIVELMVAVLIIVIGLLGTFVLLDGAQRTSQENRARIAAVNLGRQITEISRSLDYDVDLRPDVAGTGIASALQSRPGLAGTGNPWPVVRRNNDGAVGVTYMTGVTVCTFDDPKDGLAPTASAPANACTPAATAIAGAPVETNPDDFRRVTVTMTWQREGRTRTQSQTALIANPSGGLGPRILTFPQPPNQITAGNGVTLGLTTTLANNVRWTVDSLATDDAAVGDATRRSWTINWDIGDACTLTCPSGTVVDGTYAVDAQPFNDVGIPGETRTAVVSINRSLPLAPASLAGGRNERFGDIGGIVDLDWLARGERDVLGFRVYRVDAAGRTPVCGSPTPVTVTSCVDQNPPAANPLTYEVVGVDRTDLVNASSAPREGAVSTLAVGAAGTAPDPPTGLDAAIVAGKPTLNWSAPAGGAPVAFYRIYRRANSAAVPVLGSRHDGTLTNVIEGGEPEYVDSDAEGDTYTYWVTAVGSDYNESDFSAPDATP